MARKGAGWVAGRVVAWVVRQDGSPRWFARVGRQGGLPGRVAGDPHGNKQSDKVARTHFGTNRQTNKPPDLLTNSMLFFPTALF